MIPRDVLRSDAWRSLGINERRVVDFLLLEHLSKGGRENGKLKAPYRQLDLAWRPLARERDRARKQRGLIACTRGGQRVATVYAIAGWRCRTAGCRRKTWRAFRRPNLPHTGNPGLHHKGNPDAPNLPHKGNPVARKICIPRGCRYLDSTSNHAATDSIGERGKAPSADAALRARRAAAGGSR